MCSGAAGRFQQPDGGCIQSLPDGQFTTTTALPTTDSMPQMTEPSRLHNTPASIAPVITSEVSFELFSVDLYTHSKLPPATPSPTNLAFALFSTFLSNPSSTSTQKATLNIQLASTQTTLAATASSVSPQPSSNEDPTVHAGRLSSSAEMAVAIVCAVLGTVLLGLGGLFWYRWKQRRNLGRPGGEVGVEVYKAELHGESREPVEAMRESPVECGDVKGRGNGGVAVYELDGGR